MESGSIFAMASTRSLVIIPEEDRVIVLHERFPGPNADETAASPLEAAFPLAELATWIESHKARGALCAVALRSCDCLFARFTTPDSKSRLNHQELTYLAEACLPLSSEDMFAVFWPVNDSREQTVMACRLSFLEPLLRQCAAVGLRIKSVVPAVVAGLDGVLTDDAVRNSAAAARAVAPDLSDDELRWDERGILLDWAYHRESSPASAAIDLTTPNSSDVENAGTSADKNTPVQWTFADLVRGATGENPSNLLDRCNFLSDPRLAQYAESRDQDRINVWCMGLIAALAILSGGLLWRVSELRHVEQAVFAAEDEVIDEALKDLPKNRRNSRQLDAKLARLRQWEKAKAELAHPHQAEQIVSDVFHRFMSPAAPQLKKSSLPTR